MTNKEVFGFNMFGTFRAGDIAILCQRESTHMVLIDYIGVDLVALGFEELSCPEDISDFIIQTNDFAFARAFGKNLMFCG